MITSIVVNHQLIIPEMIEIAILYNLTYLAIPGASSEPCQISKIEGAFCVLNRPLVALKINLKNCIS